jgi:alkylation response protein AidB-like acyl-CoA dehydrogenase
MPPLLTPMPSPVADAVRLPAPRHGAGLLDLVAAQAERADRTRSVAPEVIAAIKASPLLAMSASKELGGGEESVAQIGAELAAIAGACASTAWCLWNHLCVFHLYCGSLGPAHQDLLAGIVARHEWVSFPAGAGSRVYGRRDGDHLVLDGPAAFGSGARYGEWAGVVAAVTDHAGPARGDDLRFSIVRLDEPGVAIEPTWDGMGLRASATDTVRYDGVAVPADRFVPWYAANRAEALRDPDLAVIHPRYREDWVGLSDLWLASMAVGVATAALDEAVAGIAGRKAIMGAKMAEMPLVQANLGEVAALVGTASAAVERAGAEVDDRVDAAELPTESDLQRQQSVSATALRLVSEAMQLLLRTLGGNGLRESGSFERRYRDVAGMPIHINAHPDRVHSRLGQLLLDAPLNRF